MVCEEQGSDFVLYFGPSNGQILSLLAQKKKEIVGGRDWLEKGIGGGKGEAEREEREETREAERQEENLSPIGSATYAESRQILHPLALKLVVYTLLQKTWYKVQMLPNQINE